MVRAASDGSKDVDVVPMILTAVSLDLLDHIGGRIYIVLHMHISHIHAYIYILLTH